MATTETATYECARGCVWTTGEGRFSSFESRPCPRCGCASRLVSVHAAIAPPPYTATAALTEE